MNIVPAKSFDIPQIMNIERASFIPSIQESQKTFEERLCVFPQGFLLLQDSSEEVVLKTGHAQTAGYFCSEIWNTIPNDDNFFVLGHSPSKVHCQDGPVLYVSSFALFPEYRSRHLAKPFFYNSLCSICTSMPKIKTVLLLVNEEWSGAKHIYESLGFKEIRVLNDFFPSLHKLYSNGILMTSSSQNFIIVEENE